jgi:glycosyltransferase involved in cell wall biosynthesis
MKVIYFSQSYTVHDYRFLEKLSHTHHQVWYLRYNTNPTVYEARRLPDGIQSVDWYGNRVFRPGLIGKTKLLLEYRSILKQIKPDLVHAGPVITCGFFTAITGFRPFLLMPWGSDILLCPDQKRKWRWIAKYTISRSDMITCDAGTVRDKILQLVQYPTDKIVVFPWGIELSQFHPKDSSLQIRTHLNWPEDSPILISTRALEPVYGIEVFLQAIEIVIKKTQKVRVLMIGDGSLMDFARRFLSKHGIVQFVHLTGRVPNEFLVDYLNEADLYVTSSYSDGTSTALLEALACALPVIVSDIPSNREWVKPGINGWLVPPGDPVILAQTILEALEQKHVRMNIKTNNLSLAQERADWNRNFQLLMNMYDLLNTKNTAP